MLSSYSFAHACIPYASLVERKLFLLFVVVVVVVIYNFVFHILVISNKEKQVQ